MILCQLGGIGVRVMFLVDRAIKRGHVIALT